MDNDGFIKVIDINDKDEITREVFTSGGKYSTQTEEKMLIDMKGISINATPRKDGRFQGYVLRDGEKQYFYGKTRKDVQAKIQAYLQTTPAPKRKKRKTDTSPLFEEFCENWIEKYKAPNLKPKSLESLKFALKRAKETFGENNRKHNDRRLTGVFCGNAAVSVERFVCGTRRATVQKSVCARRYQTQSFRERGNKKTRPAKAERADGRRTDRIFAGGKIFELFSIVSDVACNRVANRRSLSAFPCRYSRRKDHSFKRHCFCRR